MPPPQQADLQAALPQWVISRHIGQDGQTTVYHAANAVGVAAALRIVDVTANGRDRQIADQDRMHRW